RYRPLQFLRRGSPMIGNPWRKRRDNGGWLSVGRLEDRLRTLPHLEALEERTLLSTATHLAFGQQPGDTALGPVFSPPVSVLVEDEFNHVVSSSPSVSIGIGNNPSGATLLGTTPVTASGGIATFNDLALSRAGAGYTLVASVASLPRPRVG